MKHLIKLFRIVSIAALIACAVVSCEMVGGETTEKPKDPPTSTPTRVTGVSLSKSSASLTVGDTTTLIATVSPSTADNKSVTWSTSDASKATVRSGIVKGVAKGTAKITVTAADGGYTATCNVTVRSASRSAR